MLDYLIEPVPRQRRADGLAALALAAVVLLAHGGALHDGLFFDDHWHRVTLRDYGWSLHDLTESATFDLPGRLAHIWWLEQPLQWRYARPVAMLFMKLEYLASSGNPAGIHAFGLLWHWLCGLLVYRIASWALRSRGWALLAATLFLIHPQSVFSVSWTAARNAAVSAFFFLAAVQLYARGSLIGRTPRTGWSTPCIALAGLSWLLALFSRETAIVFPLIVPLLDLGAGGWRIVRQRAGVYLLLLALLAGYLYWRLIVFPTGGPPSIYFTAPHGLTYALWAAGKLLHMLFAHLVHTPMFLGLATYSGSGGQHGLEYAAMLALVLLLLALYLLAARREPTRWFWLAWLVAAFLPVVPVFVMPHFSYLPVAATAVMIAILVRRLRGAWRAAGVVFVVAYAVWPLVIYRYAWRGIVRSEQLVYADVLNQTHLRAARDAGGATLRPPKFFFINLPVTAIYAAVAMREACGRDDIEGHVLTFAPHPLMMTQPSTVERVGERTLVLSTPAPGWFSGMSGHMLRDGMRGGAGLAAGTTASAPEFDVRVLEADERGVTRLEFTFRRPLDSPDYFFFLSTPDQPALRLWFGDQPHAAAPPPNEAWLAERQAYFNIIETVRRIVRSDLYLTGE